MASCRGRQEELRVSWVLPAEGIITRVAEYPILDSPNKHLINSLQANDFCDANKPIMIIDYLSNDLGDRPPIR